ncbi:zinc finger protein [Aspergillus niger CBS 101883]|uniref:Contig An02c0010, genomic contig n=3 Tax=Aspergillus niger TaxID=5061 RepID=A2QBR1_ASPNC|nr:uncharacterized protein BO96DRAFT_472061 [Aspergillus niger CBS 101883]XP_059605976.1 uncharacterized protein An02g00950 [Aspergillus niger]PYH62179.1 hypothetical protein BO96DRAFT_472061 [Aspergillus niger CBS 101883]RDH25010.1 hypothetical protein M747DRAFT_352318 [Aspergillus niger ATCC 13496]CAK96308.1 unnamed protein product [Aspergillus niger]
MQSKYYCIGAGFCGTVWTLAEVGLAIKREDGGPDRSLANDYAMNQRVLRCLSRLTDIKSRRSINYQAFPQVRVSQCHRFIPPSDRWWSENLPLFPSQHSPCNAIVSDRIPPFPEQTRELIVNKYFNPKIQMEILTTAANRDCLIRPYLDQMEDIGISIENMQKYARMMGEALATLHWLGEMDGNDIEFVLAPLPFDEQQPNTDLITDVLGQHTMWMLDFDLCQPMPMSDDGVQQAVTAFWRNDPFYPRPQRELWDVFREQYLITSETIISGYNQVDIDQRLSLARRFIELIETN